MLHCSFRRSIQRKLGNKEVRNASKKNQNPTSDTMTIELILEREIRNRRDYKRNIFIPVETEYAKILFKYLRD